jgi:hypothetical protein
MSARAIFTPTTPEGTGRADAHLPHPQQRRARADRPAPATTGQGFCGCPAHAPAFSTAGRNPGHLQLLTGLQLVDLHVSDLLNAQLPSHYDYTSQYDLLVFRRLARQW